MQRCGETKTDRYLERLHRCQGFHARRTRHTDHRCGDDGCTYWWIDGIETDAHTDWLDWGWRFESSSATKL